MLLNTVRRRISAFWPCWTAAILLSLLLTGARSTVAAAQSASPPLPELTGPVNDFAHVIDPDSSREMDRMIRELQDKTGDVVIVATVPTLAPFGDIREYATKLFENRGRGIGDKAKDNGLLLLVAPNDRRVWVEVGYGLEQWITDGFAGETSRDFMAPEFRQGRFGPGILAGATRIIGRIAQGRNVQLTGVEPPRAVSHPRAVPESIVIVATPNPVGATPERSIAEAYSAPRHRHRHAACILDRPLFWKFSPGRIRVAPGLIRVAPTQQPAESCR